MKLTDLAYVAIFLPAAAFAMGGGSIVGNGAGLAEQNVIFAYVGLPAAVDHCLGTGACGLSAEEQDQLVKIRAVLTANAGKSDMIRFKSGKDDPTFFELSTMEQHRIARTELNADASIWLNTDLLYDDKGDPALDLFAATAILIHEVGHQSGNPDHAFLDQLGAKIRYSLMQKSTSFSYDDAGCPVQVQLVNYELPNLAAGLFTTAGGNTLSLSNRVRSALHCSGPDASVMGFEIWNGHWEDPSDVPGGQLLPFAAWVRYSCLSNGQVTLERANLNVTFSLPDDGLPQFKAIEVTPISLIAAAASSN